MEQLQEQRRVLAGQDGQDIARLQVSANSLLNWLLQRKSLKALQGEPGFVVEMLAGQVAAAMALYLVGNELVTLELPELVVPEVAWWKAVGELRERMQAVKEDIVEAVVFSSVADGQVVRHWSDLDVWVVVKDAVVADGKRFVAFREAMLAAEECLYAFDPWQHHGMQFVLESDLRWYPEAMLPVAVLERGKSLLGGRRVEMRVRDSREEQEGQLYGIGRLMTASAKSGVMGHHCREDVCLQADFKGAEDAFYQLKYFVSVIALVPALFLGLVEKPIYKKESFERIGEYFSEEELELVRACERVRSVCEQVEPVGNAIPTKVQEVLGGRYFERAADFMRLVMARYEEICK